MRTVAEIEAARAARRASLAEAAQAQLAVDLEALDAAEIEHGDNRITRLNVPFSPGLPTLVALRTPNTNETKRYRAMCKPKGDRPADTVTAAEQLGSSVTVYPDPKSDLFTALCTALPGLLAQIGLQAAKLAVGEEEAQGKG